MNYRSVWVRAHRQERNPARGLFQVKYKVPSIGHDKACKPLRIHAQIPLRKDIDRSVMQESINERLAEDVDCHFPVFAQAYETLLREYVIGRGADPSDADDIAQDSLVKMYFWLKGCNPQKIRESDLKSYLYRIAENCVRIKQREYKRRYNPPRSPGSFFETSDADMFDELIGEEKQPRDPEDVYLYKEWRQEVLQHLTEEYRKVFIAHLNGWTIPEIAAHFGIPSNSVKYILRQSRKILQSLPGLRY